MNDFFKFANRVSNTADSAVILRSWERKQRGKAARLQDEKNDTAFNNKLKQVCQYLVTNDDFLWLVTNILIPRSLSPEFKETAEVNPTMLYKLIKSDVYDKLIDEILQFSKGDA